WSAARPIISWQWKIRGDRQDEYHASSLAGWSGAAPGAWHCAHCALSNARRKIHSSLLSTCLELTRVKIRIVTKSDAATKRIAPSPSTSVVSDLVLPRSPGGGRCALHIICVRQSNRWVSPCLWTSGRWWC
ncbi:hypothetical protein EMPG_10094, partial [Blastomyces silverae]